MKLTDKAPYSLWRTASARLLSIVLIAALMWSTAGIVPAANAGPVGPKHTWQLLSGDHNFVDVAFGNGVYVGVTERQEYVGMESKIVSTVWMSDNMLDWTSVDVSAITTRPIAKIEYYGDRFVMTTKRSDDSIYTGTVMLYSSDGEHWTGLSHSVSDALYSTTYTSGLYFSNRYFAGAANGPQGRVYNPSASTWSSAVMSPPKSYATDMIVHDGKLFVGSFSWDTELNMGLAVTEDGGATWTTFDPDTLASVRAFASNGSTLIGVGGGGDGENYSSGKPGAVVINWNYGFDVTKGELSGPFQPQNGEFVSASYSSTEQQFLALTRQGTVYYSADEGATWHPDYSTMGAGTGLVSTVHGDFAFTSAGVFKRAALGDHTIDASVTGTLSTEATLTVSVHDSGAVPVSEAGVVYSTSDTRLPDDPQQAGIAGTGTVSTTPFDVTVSGLAEDTEYYYWPYSKDTMGYMYYGERGSFRTIAPAETPIFVTQPEGATVLAGDPGPVLSVTAVVYDGGTLTYQWYTHDESSNNGGNPIDGAVQSTFVAPTDALGTVYYYAGVTNTVTGDGWTNDSTAYSSPAQVTVYPNLPKVINDIDDQTLTGLEAGYAAGTQEARSILITNMGTTDLNNIAVTLGGLHAGSFRVTQLPTVLAKGAPAASLTISAADGLSAGTYEAVITITADAMAPVSFKVLQLVNNANAPEIPRNLTAVGGSGTVELNWNTVTGATYYNVYMSTASMQYDAEPVASTPDTTYTAQGLTNGTTYYFVVRSGSAENESGFSNQASATPTGVPGAPTDVTAAAGNMLAQLSFAVPVNGGSPITGYEVLTSSDEFFEFGTSLPLVVQGLENGQAYTFEVRAVNAAGPGPWSAVSNEVKPFRPGTYTPIEDDAPDSGEDDVEVLVNGEVERIGQASTATVDGRTVTTIAVDEARLRERLALAGQSPVITLPVAHDSDVIIGELTGRMVEELEGYGAVVEVRTPRGAYAIPAAQIDIAAVAAQLGSNLDLADIKLRIEIAASLAETTQAIKDTASRNGLELIAEPVHYAVTAWYNDTAIEIEAFKQYVERSIAIPDGVDPGKITTGIVRNSDGTLRHVPTYVTEEDGRYHAVINSLTNSDYAIVWNPIEFNDATGHWSKMAVNDMGSRLIVNGIGDGLFGPNRSVTRAEFTVIVATGLGLKSQPGASQFADVRSSDWFASSVNAAAAYGLVSGYENGEFRPQQSITREQAMVIIAKAMVVTGLQAKLQPASGDTLRQFADADQVSGWAASSVADNVQSGIAQGKGGGRLDPRSNVTRAEAAVLIRKLLEKSGLI